LLFEPSGPSPARGQKEARRSSEESSQASPKGQRGNPGRKAEPCQAVPRRAAGHQQRGRTKRPSGSAAGAEMPEQRFGDGGHEAALGQEGVASGAADGEGGASIMVPRRPSVE